MDLRLAFSVDQGEPVRCARRSTDGRLVLAGCGDVVRVWRFETGELLGKLVGHDGPVLDVGISRANKTVTTSGADGAIRSWNSADRRPTDQFRERSHYRDGSICYDVCMSADGLRTIVWHSSHACGYSANAWDLGRYGWREGPQSIPVRQKIDSACVSDDHRYFATHHHHITVYDLKDPASGRDVQADCAEILSFSSDSSAILYRASWNPKRPSQDNLVLVDWASGRELFRAGGRWETGCTVRSGRTVVGASVGGEIAVFDVATQERVFTHEVRAAVACIVPSGEGASFLVGDRQGWLSGWELLVG